MFLESWKDSWKNWSQKVNALIGLMATAYVGLTEGLKMDLPPYVVSVLAVAAFANIVIRNWPQKNKLK